MRKIKRGRRRARHLIPRRRNRVPWAPFALGFVIIIAVGTAALFEVRRDGNDETGLLEYARASQGDPVRMVVDAGHRHQIIFLGDVLPALEPKRIAADAIEALAHGPGLDAVVLEVGSDLQRRIDTYLETDPENTRILLAEPRAVHDQWGVTTEYLELYRRVWRLNRTLPPGRRIRILAADLPGWPPSNTISPNTAAAQYAQRDAHMTELIESTILARSPRARLLIFMGGYHGLKSGQAELQTGLGAPIPIVWLATRLRQLHPGEVFTIVTDGAARPLARGPFTGYVASDVFDFLRKRLPDATRPFALTVDGRFDFLRAPLRATAVPGLEMKLRPDNYRLQDVADGYIFLGTAGTVGATRR
jgi:hypothetical protein